jgi:diaminohydroxyphosphoribosylaminopyrimidine deaminase/5-amino-6-(5-phosphoribosylamino)uracil reductase
VTEGVSAAPSAQELGLLARARELAQRGRGRVSPNPLVGAVVIREGRVVGEGWHEGPGTPHAEVGALREAGDGARGATLVCTLEPCSHHGRTPPCADAVVAAGVARVVVGCLDPLERGRDGGASVLAAAGVDVVVAPPAEADACRELNAAFVTHSLTGRPFVTLKMATSLDGRVATADGETRWITGPTSRSVVHRMRADADAVAVGIGTAVADDPGLTVRGVAEAFRPPRRVVFDREARLPLDGGLVRSAREVPVIVLAGRDAPVERRRALEAAGVAIVLADGVDEAMEELGRLDIQSLLVEGGPTLAAALLVAGAVDRLAWFVAPIVIGGRDAPAAVAGAGLGALAGVPRLTDPRISRHGDDVLIEGALRPLPEG